MEVENWKVIDECPDYEVSDQGRVRNLKSGLMMKISVKDGYSGICLVKDEGKRISAKVHRLVAKAFIDNPENKPEVNHKNKIRTDNRVQNLEWNTRKENCEHRSIGLVYSSNKKIPVCRIDRKTGAVLEEYESIEDAGTWAAASNLSNNADCGQKAVANCIRKESKSAYGFFWERKVVHVDAPGEEWREVDLQKLLGISEHKRKYYVSSLGRFKNNDGRIMSDYKVSPSGYIRVYIISTTFLVHRLVAMTFIANPLGKEQVNHKDGNKTNNAVANLEWVTNAENHQHRADTGLGNFHTRKVLQVDLEGNVIAKHESIVSAAESMKLSKSTVANVMKGIRKTAGGHVWRYEDDLEYLDGDSTNMHVSNLKWKDNKHMIAAKEGVKQCNTPKRPVLRLNLDGTMPIEFDCIASASKASSVSCTSIRTAMDSGKPSGNFLWKHIGPLKKFLHKRKIAQMDAVGNILQEHESISSAARSLNLKLDTGIREALTKKRATASGYVWKYLE